MMLMILITILLTIVIIITIIVEVKCKNNLHSDAIFDKLIKKDDVDHPLLLLQTMYKHSISLWIYTLYFHNQDLVFILLTSSTP